MAMTNYFAVNDTVGPAQFSMASMTAAINRVPAMPDGLEGLVSFSEHTLDTRSVILEELIARKFRLVRYSEDDAPMDVEKRTRAAGYSFNTPYLGVRDYIKASEVEGWRQPGTEASFMSWAQVMSERMDYLNRNLDVTLLWHHMQALTKGHIYDPNDLATPMFNWFTILGKTPTVAPTIPNPGDPINFATITEPELVNMCEEIIRTQKNVMRGTPYGGSVVLCSESFFKKLRHCTALVNTFERVSGIQNVMAPFANLMNQPGDMRRVNLAYGRFEFAGLTWQEYYSGNDVEIVTGETTTTATFIDANKAYVVPGLALDVHRQYYGPDHRLNTVNRRGLPRYSMSIDERDQSGREVRAWCYPVAANAFPDATIELTAA